MSKTAKPSRPSGRTTPRPRYRVVVEYAAYIDKRGKTTYHAMGPKGCAGCCATRASANKICRLLNAAQKDH